MAYHAPDYEFIQGKSFLEGSKGKDWDLARYYVESKDREISRLNRIISEMSAVFKGIKQFID